MVVLQVILVGNIGIVCTAGIVCNTDIVGITGIADNIGIVGNASIVSNTGGVDKIGVVGNTGIAGSADTLVSSSNTTFTDDIGISGYSSIIMLVLQIRMVFLLPSNLI